MDYDNGTRAEFTHARAQEFKLRYILREAIGPGKEVTSHRIQCHSCNNGPKNAQEEKSDQAESGSQGQVIRESRSQSPNLTLLS